MASKKIQAGIKGSIANPEAAQAVLAKLDETALIAANVAEIADPATATAEDCANKINELLAALVAAGLMEA